MRVVIETIKHKHQRYDTCGDWQFLPPDTLFITVSELKDWKREMLIAVHELIECLTCQTDGVSQEVVDKFDMSWAGEGEPGDDPNAPYFYQHLLATQVEQRLAYRWGVDWNAYEKQINSLQWRPHGRSRKTPKGESKTAGEQRGNITEGGGQQQVVPDGKHRTPRRGKC